ncbi:nuclear transport factor 2 family protein [Sinosporangium siamense]|uniref:PhzA/B-like protein n=1 Tax=Sinosporangium siamense TaxID=1367973 RepID=A0A919RLC8_9ACTN|nr:nuclear transport factor 2 family protein [Sinosporangium siamense]GII95893.1 putative PhzA/B-like protein [Sinosporangium siamense]
MPVTGGPREILARLHRHLTGGSSSDDLWAEDVVVEVPFAPPGAPRRFEGREAFLAHVREGRAKMRMRLEVGKVVIYETADPDVIVTEYELSGIDPASGERLAAPFIGVLKVRDGQIAGWREYQDMLASAASAGRLTELLGGVAAKV